MLPLIHCRDLVINVNLVPYVRGRNRKPLPWSRHGIWFIFHFLSLECVIIDNRSCGWKRWVVILFSELIKNHYNSTKLDAHSISLRLTNYLTFQWVNEVISDKLNGLFFFYQHVRFKYCQWFTLITVWEFLSLLVIKQKFKVQGKYGLYKNWKFN